MTVDTVFANTVLSIQHYSLSGLSLAGLSLSDFSLSNLSLSIPNDYYAMVVDGGIVDDRGSWLVTAYIITYPAEVFSAKILDDPTESFIRISGWTTPFCCLKSRR